MSLPVDTAQGDLVIASVGMLTPAWLVLDLSPLWGPAAVRGENAALPRVAGKLALPRWVDETTFSLPFVIVGDCDLEDTPYDDPVDGLQQNLAYLWENVFIPPEPPAATVSATLTLPDGTELDMDVQPSMDPPETIGVTAISMLVLRIAGGRFPTTTGS